MKVQRHLINYQYEFRKLQHHILFLEHSTSRILLSAVNLFLHDKCINSLKTSERYSLLFVKFFEFMIEMLDDEYLTPDFWRLVTDDNIREWQGYQVKIRDDKNKTKPNDDTIFDNASIIFSFYVWARKKSFPTLINATSTNWKFNYIDESKLLSNKNMLSGSSPDTANIDVGNKRSRNWNKRKKSLITIMSNSDIKALMNSYNDKVYPAMLMYALATGLRSEGVCDVPYIGYGVNNHLRVYPEITNTAPKNGKGETPDTFEFTVTEKGSKTRTIKVNMSAWKTICAFYLPLYFERRQLFEKRHPNKSHDSYFFLTAKGDPVTPKKIADATNYAKSKLNNFKWSFHSTRDWYATSFIIKHLSKKQIENAYYDNSVDKALQEQLGHNDIKTTYMFYIRVASIILALESGELDFTLGKNDDYWSDLAQNS
ncbi:tyrosine-type recombinase/integrase [Photobacterium sagamiensis]|uniref:site-specific integrase n=1 Tax=Photobacterium sagamiensis TaxID=2910241 RepID=UPI003D0DA1E1